MRAGDYPMVRDLVLAGGGHAHALVARAWAMDPMPGVRLTLINPGPAAPYTGMLPGLIAGHYRRDEIMIDLVRLARAAGARLILDRVTGIDRAARQLHLAGRPPLPYDLLSVDIGIGSDLPDLPGYAAHGVAAKPLGAYAEAWDAFVARALPAPQVTVIGAGLGGIELALASHHRLQAAGARPVVRVIERGTPLPHVGAAARARLLAACRSAGIEVLEGAEVAEIGADRVRLADGRALPSDFTLAVAGSRPQRWLEQTGLQLHQGFIAVGPSLQSSDPLIFAAGDCAHLTHAPRPKAGVFAVRQAPVLAANLRAALTDGRMRDYHPQRDYLKLVSLGTKAAVADKLGLRAGGPWVWRQKDRIDRRFMAMFNDLPAMPAPALPPGPLVPGLAEAMGPKPLCGGCGAKLGAEALSAALAALPPPGRPEVQAGRGDDAAVLAVPGGVQVLTTDLLRAFWADPRVMAQIAAVHALGDVWAMGAAPQVALAQVILPRLSDTLGARVLAEVMAGAGQILAAAGADVVGGHSAIGAELTVGFTVTGLATRPVTKAGARPGDALILTKALGTGTIMAAEMAAIRLPGGILGEVVAAALAQMAAPSAAAAALLAPVAHAMTDVTGFGLAGHLLEMLEASGAGATLDGAEIPLLPGAAALAAAGTASSLAPQNRAAVLGRLIAAEGPLKALLIDPQTSGGLLAAVPAAAAADLVAALRAGGDHGAAVIGQITRGPARITLTPPKE